MAGEIWLVIYQIRKTEYHTSLDRDAAIAIGVLLCNHELFNPNADTLNWHIKTLSESDCEKRKFRGFIIYNFFYVVRINLLCL